MMYIVPGRGIADGIIAARLFPAVAVTLAGFSRF